MQETVGDGSPCVITWSWGGHQRDGKEAQKVVAQAFSFTIMDGLDYSILWMPKGGTGSSGSTFPSANIQAVETIQQIL